MCCGGNGSVGRGFLPGVCGAGDLVACYCSVGGGLGGQEGDGCEGACE